MAHALGLAAQAPGAEQGFEFAQRRCKIIIKYKVVVLVEMADLADRVRHATLNDRLAVLAAAGQPLLQGLAARRENKYLDRLRKSLEYLPCALPVDFQNDVFAGLQAVQEGGAAGTVIVAEYLRVFEKLASGHQALEFRPVDKMIVAAVLLPGPRRPGGMRHRHRDAVDALQQCLDQAGFTGPGRRGNNI